MDGGPLPALHDMRARLASEQNAPAPFYKVADVPPEHYGSAAWETWLEPFVKLGEKRHPSDPHTWADNYLRHHEDTADLRALGFCRTCGRPGSLMQIGRSVYFGACDHYRAQGFLSEMRPYLEKRVAAMTPDRRASLLALIGR